MAKITASLSSKVDGRGKSEILLRFVGGRDHIFRLHSGLFVTPGRWKDGAVVIPRVETDEQKDLKKTRDRLKDLQAWLLDEFDRASSRDMSKEWMQEAVDRFHHPELGGGGRGSFFPVFREFVKAKKGTVSVSRMKRYEVTRRSLERWEKVRRRRLVLDGFTKEDVAEFEQFLLDEHGLVDKKKWREMYGKMSKKVLPKERSRNTLLDYTGVLRAFFHWARNEGKTTSEPFAGYSIGDGLYGTPYYITIEERERLYKTDLRDRPELAAQRDVFVFQCLVGCRVGDLVKFRKGDIVDGVLEYIPHKTKEEAPRTVRVPLSETAKEIVARYAGFRGEKLLPFISPQKYNEAIKKAFTAAGITRMVAVLDPLTREEVKRPLNEIASSHLARRTFIGNLYKQVKDPNLIGSMSGHSEGSRAFARYRDIDDEMKSDIVQLLEGKKGGK